MDLGTVLGVWAHPDDENYLSGGIMADAVERGNQVTILTATRGQAGTPDPERWPPEQLGALREKELEAAMAVLGVTDIRWLDYFDGMCELEKVEEGAAAVGDVIKDVQPRSVLTFGPEGMTGHPDHIAVSRWATIAFERWAPPGAKLYYAAAPKEWAEQWGDVFDRYNIFAPGLPMTYPPDELVITFPLRGELLKRKNDAILQHESQIDPIVQQGELEILFELNKVEWFRLGAEKPDV
jgi:LmbE family N-acetylglucosaminyl deacetylase